MVFLKSYYVAIDIQILSTDSLVLLARVRSLRFRARRYIY
jgi:hypothetical protein